MKKTLLFLIAVFFAALSAFAQCDAPTNVQAVPHWNRVNLSWESSNMGFLDTLTYDNDYYIRIGTNSADTFTVAVRYTPTQLSSVNGQYLTHVGFVPGETNVHEFTIKVWVGGSHPNASTFNEGNLVSSEVILPSQVTTGTYNVFPLTTPVLIDATQELWIGYECTAIGGYPAGAGDDNVVTGSNDLIQFGGNWGTLSASNLSYGWCINGYTKDRCFNVFRDNVQLNTSLISDHSYVDQTILPQNPYCYYIQSVCASSTASSPQVCVTTPIQPNCGPTVGNGTNTTYMLPFNTYYYYSYTQQLYTAAELGASAPGSIASISFNYFHSTPITMNDITVYMGNVSESSFATTTSWIPASNLSQVFHGSVHCTNTDSNLVTIDFDDFFEWDGHSNVVVAIVNKQGSSLNTEYRFYTHPTTDNTVLNAYSNNGAYNIVTPGAGTLGTGRNNMRFCFGPNPSCYRPYGLMVENTTGNGATLSWRRHSNTDNQWEVITVPAGASINTGTAVTVNDTTITLNNLLENEEYDMYVRMVCSPTDQSSWAKITFRTRCVSIHEGVPYGDNFTDYGTGTSAFPFCWQRSTNHESITYPYITAATSATGQMVFFSNASTYSLAVSQGLDLSAYPAGSLALTYWIAQLYTYYGRMDIGIMTNPNDMSTFTLLRSYYPSDYKTTGVFQEDTIFLPENYPDVVYLAFLAPACGSNSTNMVHLSHVKVSLAPTCIAPSNLTVSHLEGTSAILSWQEAQLGANSYTLAYGVAGQTMTSVTVSGTDYMLTGLTHGTTYNVMLYTNCTNEHSDTLTLSFTTLPFVECVLPDVTITGTTASTSYLIPVNNYYNYTYSQQIFTANEISSSHTPTVITGIAFEYNYTSSNTAKTNVRIYLAHRNSSSFASTSDWTPIANATLVYEGNLICTQGWNTFDFDTAFTYNGTDNLVLIVDDNSGAYNSSSHVFKTHTASSNASIYYYNDNINPDPASPPTGTLFSSRNNVKFLRCSQTVPVSCPNPYVYVTDTDNESVTIGWVANGTENEWNLEYRTEGSNSWTSVGVVSASPYTITELNTDTQYEIRLQALCSTTDSSEWAYTSAYTPCESVELPIVENFESYNNNELPACWQSRTNATSLVPYISSTQYYSGSKSLYFYCPSDGNYAYAISPRLDDNTAMDSLQIMFYAYTATAGYFIEVGIMSDPNDLRSFTLLGQFSPSDIQTWELGEVLSRGYAGTGKYVVFRVPQWYANNIYIDDIDIHYIPSCMHVNNIQASNITPETADVTWTAGSGESQWNYIYAPAGTVDLDEDVPTLVNNNTITISGLTANTLYEIYVQAYCNADDQSTWMHNYFRTACAAMTTLPYEENFDTYTGTTSTATNVLPNCWERINGGTSYAGLPTIYNNSSYAQSGHNSLYFYTSTGTTYTDQYAIMPEIDTISIPMNTLQLNFAARSSSASYSFNIQVGVMTDPTDPTTFQLVQLVPVTGTSYTNHEVYFNNFNGNGNYVAFKVEKPTSGYNYGYIDDIVLEEIPSCSPVHNVTISHIAGTSALVSWESGHFGTVTAYALEYSEAGQDNWVNVSNNITGTSQMLSNLEPTTSYDVRVSSTCEDGETSNWVVESFATKCMATADLSIGNGTTTSYNIPLNNFYRYTYSEQIFLASELTGINSINSISFDYAYSSATSSKTSVDIYLKHTTQSSFSTTSDYIDIAGAQLVYQGHLNCHQGWNTFDFITPFQYDGTSNLVLIVDDNSNAYDGNAYNFHIHTTGSVNRTLYYYSDSNNPQPGNLSGFSGTKTVTANRNNVIFGNCDYTATCFAPNMYVDNIDTTSADIIWVAGYDETNWELEYALYGDTTNWTPIANPTGGTVALDQLTPNTHYSVRMRSNCDGGFNSAWTTTDFRTECSLSTIPYTENFNDYGTGTNAFPDCWTKHTTYSTTTYPYINSINNSGTTGGSMYYYASASTYNITVMPELNTDVNTLEVTFYLRVGTLSNGLVVGVMNSATDFDNFVPIDTVFCSSTGGFQYQEVDLDSYTGTGRFIAFKTYIQSTGGLYMDDLNIVPMPSCKRPGNVTASNIGLTSATIAWTERGNANEWEIEYGPAGFTPGNNTGIIVQTNTNPFTLNNLTVGTEYDAYVRSNCGAGDISEVSLNHANFATDLCASSDRCEYTIECADSYGDGWNNASLSIQQNGITYATVTFDNGSSYIAHVMLCDNVSSALVWNEGSFDDECSFTVKDPAGTIIYTGSNLSSGSLFTFTTDCNATPPTCDAPTNLNISNITENSATVTWTAGGSETSWKVAYKLHSASQWTENNVSQTSYTMTGLSAASNYDVRVTALCDNNLESTPASTTFTTSVGIDNLALLNSISLLPNPADKYIELRVNSPITMTEALVYNAFGQLIQTVELTDNHARIDLSEMAAGMYFVRVNGDNGSATKKFIKK